MDGQMPQTFVQGFLSGLGHPVIGWDHLAAIAGVGILAALVGRGAAAVLAFGVAMMAGVGVHLLSLDMPAAELLVGLSTLAIGLLVLFRVTMGFVPAALVFAAAGLFHGYALGESIIGAETAPLSAYLVGLFIIQTAISLGAFAFARFIIVNRPALRPTAITAAGALIAIAGGVASATAAGLLG
jgi:urease accessory protein